MPPPTGRASVQDHTPAHPSGLRQSHTASSYGSIDEARTIDNTSVSPRSRPVHEARENAPSLSLAGPSGQRHDAPSETTSLLGETFSEAGEHVHDGPCNHGTLSPKPGSPAHSLGADSHIHSGSESDSAVPSITRAGDGNRRRWKRFASSMRSKKMSTSTVLAQRHGVKASALM